MSNSSRMSDIALDWMDLLVILSVLAAFGTLAGLGSWLIRRFAAPKRIEPPAQHTTLSRSQVNIPMEKNTHVSVDADGAQIGQRLDQDLPLPKIRAICVPLSSVEPDISGHTSSQDWSLPAMKY